MHHAGHSSNKPSAGTEKLQFSSFEEQRAHFKSDWHRLNVKRKLLGRPPLDEDSSDALLGGDQDEVAGHLELSSLLGMSTIRD